MPHPRTSLIGALAAAAMLVWSGSACAEAGDMAALGPGYTSADAPLGAPTELRIDLHGRVPARCELVTPPAPMTRLALSRPGEAAAPFAIDCNAPFVLRVRSGAGGFAAIAPTPGIEALTPYELAVAVDTDAGRRDLGWCDAAALGGDPVGACPFSASGAARGWSSGEETAIDRTGTVRLRWAGQDAGAPLLGAYQDTIVVELELRS